MLRALASFFTAVAVAAATIAPAVADPANQKFSVRVTYADLDLSRIEGVKTLTDRLDRAIGKACGNAQRKMSVQQTRMIKQCRATAMDQAVASIDAPLLTALHEGRAVTRFAGL